MLNKTEIRLLKTIKERTSNKWISVDDRTPEFKVRVLTIDYLGVQRVLVCDMFEGMIDWYDEEWEDFEDGLDVTHWMHLPLEPSKD